MKAFGYAKKTLSDKGLLVMSEVTLCTRPQTLRQIAQFFLAAADEMESGPGSFGHLHIQDDLDGWNADWPDIIVAEGKDEE